MKLTTRAQRGLWVHPPVRGRATPKDAHYGLCTNTNIQGRVDRSVRLNYYYFIFILLFCGGLVTTSLRRNAQTNHTAHTAHVRASLRIFVSRASLERGMRSREVAVVRAGESVFATVIVVRAHVQHDL